MKNLILLFTFGLFISLSSESFSQNALIFDGIDDRVNCANDPSIQITGTNITIEAWIYPTSWKDFVYQGNIVNKEQNAPDNGYMLRCGAMGTLNFNLGNGSWHELNSAPGALTLNTWQHVAGTYDGSVMRIYVNGVEVGSETTSFSISNSSQDLIIGDYTGESRNFPGKIDEVKIWNVARTPAEIMDDMNTSYCESSLPVTGLQAYYKFDQGIAGGINFDETILIDESGNDNNGIIENFLLAGTESNWVEGKEGLTPVGFVHEELYISACDSYTVPSGDEIYTLGGTYSDTIINPSSCDQLLTIHLSFDGTPSDTTISRSNCYSYTVPSGDETHTESGIYLDTLSEVLSGCDSIITIELTIYDASESSITAEACNSYESPGGSTYTESGTYTDIIPNMHGCDSVITIDLTIHSSEESSLSITTCDHYTVPSGDETYYETGVYQDTLVTIGGCDSIITIDLTIDEIDPAISLFPDHLSCDIAGAEYQWVNCDDSYAEIPGANEADYYPEANGNYAVIVTDGECTDTSDCQTISTLGISNLTTANFAIYPNPSNGDFNLIPTNNVSIQLIRITTMDGKLILERKVDNQQTTNPISISVPEGIYFINITYDQGNTTLPILIEN